MTGPELAKPASPPPKGGERCRGASLKITCRNAGAALLEAGIEVIVHALAATANEAQRNQKVGKVAADNVGSPFTEYAPGMSIKAIAY
jgi:hypothetical protein